MVDLLLSQPSASSSHKRALATSANRAGLLPIHAAAVAGCSTCCSLCYRAVSKSSDILAVKDKKGLTAGDWARKHGHQVSPCQQTPVSLACAISLTAAFYLCSPAFYLCAPASSLQLQPLMLAMPTQAKAAAQAQA